MGTPRSGSTPRKTNPVSRRGGKREVASSKHRLPAGIAGGPKVAAAARRPTTSRTLAIACARAADETLGEETVVLDVTGVSPAADHLVITTASSSPHFRAIGEAVEAALKENGGTLHHREGRTGSPWLLLDCHTIIVHIFSGATRIHYDLERLMADAKRVKWEKRAKSPSPPRTHAPARARRRKNAK